MKRVIISGGGTGGHIFPAIAIANALKKTGNVEILFIGAKGRMEMEKVPAAGYPIEGLTISGFQRRLTLRNLSFPFKVIGSLLKARRIISRFKPDLVIGVGGYASGPTLRMATSMGIPSLIQEQNSFPGVTNRLLAKKVRKICVAYEGMEKYFPAGKIVLTGNPIRQDVVKISGKEDEARKHFGLDPARKTLLVIGGSLGARTINQATQVFAASLPEEENIQILWQTGKFYFESIKSALENTEPGKLRPVILPFIDRMDLAYAAADVIVSRAGAIAISELCVVGKPVILVPSPNVAEDHQTKNARALAEKHAAIMITDAAAVAELGKAVLELFRDRERQTELSRNIRQLGIADAADTIAGVALGMLEKGGGPAGEGRGTWDVGCLKNVTSLKSVYFLGIGGIGMSALARYFRLQGTAVAGYDRTPTPLTAQLAGEGMVIHYEEDPARIPGGTELVIYTPAVPKDNKEYIWFREHKVPMIKRAEALGMISRVFKTIAVAGTHGKTTTSTLIAHILHTAGFSQIAFLGGISKNYGTNFLYEVRDHATETFCVAEADEYDRSFLHLKPAIAIITSADADHLDIYGSQEDLRKSFSEFTAGIGPGGSLFMKTGVQVVPGNAGNYTVYDYSPDSSAACCIENVRLTGGLFHFDFTGPAGTIRDLVLGIPGKFNLENSVAALAAATCLGIAPEHLREALRTYQGVNRRFDFRVRRDDLVYIDDYAHHPEEIKACILAARELYPGKKITGIFQPHLFSRTRDLADDFARSLGLLDELFLLDIYPARELPIKGVTSQMLLDRVDLSRKKLVRKEDVPGEILQTGPQVVLTLGAGDIDQLVEPLTNMLSSLKTQ